MTFSNNTILITGGGSGIGFGLAERLLAQGNTIILAGRSQATLDKAQQAHPQMQTMQLDQSDPDAVISFAQRIISDYPALNVVINNAGIQRVENLQLGHTAAAEEQIISNILGPIRLTAALLPHLLAQPSATLINVTSALAFVPSTMTPTYCATKAALHSYTQSLRYQLRDTAVTVLEIIPPWVQTALQGSRGHDPRAMPLEAYLTETIGLLMDPPESGEIVVSTAQALRFAERDDQFTARFATLNNGRAREFGNPPREPD